MTEHTKTDGLPGMDMPVPAPPLEAAAARSARPAVPKIECNACPVLCQISDGRTGACDRYANQAGALVRVDRVVLLRRTLAAGEAELVAFAPPDAGAVESAGDAALPPATWSGDLLHADEVFVTGVGSSTTYSDYKPALQARALHRVVEGAGRRHGDGRHRRHLQLLQLQAAGTPMARRAPCAGCRSRSPIPGRWATRRCWADHGGRLRRDDPGRPLASQARPDRPGHRGRRRCRGRGRCACRGLAALRPAAGRTGRRAARAAAAGGCRLPGARPGGAPHLECLCAAPGRLPYADGGGRRQRGAGDRRLLRPARLHRAWVNNGGDIALHLAPGAQVWVGLVADVARFDPSAMAEAAGHGIATSGWRGSSFSLGIADSVTVLARTAAEADACAMLVANAVNVDDARILRRPACDLKDDSDLGRLPVTVEVPPLGAEAVRCALAAGLLEAWRLHDAGNLWAAALVCQGRLVVAQNARAAQPAPSLPAGPAPLRVGSVFA